MRIVFIVLGWLFFSLGFIGVFLPVLPTTPFMLLALGCFTRSSPRLQHWLYCHKVFGPPLQAWQQYGVISKKAKIVSISCMSLSLLYILIFRELAWWVNTLVTMLMAYGAWFILRTPSTAPTEG